MPHWTRRETLGGLAATAALPRCASKASKPPTQPNLILMVADDLRADRLGFSGSPHVRTPNLDALAQQGTAFPNAFVAISLCSPSRATILTGCRPQRTGVFNNRGLDPDPRVPLFPTLLQQQGYQTAFFGKWHMAHSDAPRVGFDHWLSFSGQGQYQGGALNQNGEKTQNSEHLEDHLINRVQHWLTHQRDPARPFMLILSHKAVHGPHEPPERLKNAYEGIELPEPASYGDDLSTKPEYLRAHLVRGGRAQDWEKNAHKPIPDRIDLGPYPPKSQSKRDNYPGYLALIETIDQSLGKLRQTLGDLGLSQNTGLCFTSDNGVLQGEHGLFGIKQLAYEESIRVPLVLHLPWQKVPEHQEPVTVMDIAPTFLALAGAPAADMDGVSLLASGPRDQALFYEHFLDPRFPSRPHIQALRTPTYKVIRSVESGFVELYHLKADPLELHNLAVQSPGPRHEMLAQLDAALVKVESRRFETPPDPAVQRRGNRRQMGQ